MDVQTQTQEFCVIEHRPEKIDQWVESLRKRYGGRQVAICTEQKRGPLIYALCKYDFLVLFPVNPRTVAKYRQAFKPSRAKDDPTDAALLAELLCKHRDRLHPWEPQSTQMRTLAQLVESRRVLVGDKRLLVAFGDDRDRYHSAQEILRYTGIAPVKEKTFQIYLHKNLIFSC